MDAVFITSLLGAAVALSAPILFAAMGELIAETAGVINIQLEGIMLMGAFGGVYAAHLSGSAVVGFLAAAVSGLALAMLHALLCFILRANQVVSGIVLNIFALGVTSLLLATVLGPNVNQAVASLPELNVAALEEIPIIGKALFGQDLMVYVAYFLVVPGVWWVLNRRRAGLMLKAVGERPQAAESLGVSVMRVRWIAVGACGVLAGIGGGQLALAGLGFFTQNMTAGRGFIALAAVIFGRWRPLGTAGAILLFALADGLQIRAQALGIGIPFQFLGMLPYIVTLVALALLTRMRPPSALAINYERG